MPEAVSALCLRLAGPMQAWGTSSLHNRRETNDRPTKSGVIGLLAAAQGRRRGDDITDLLGLSLGVRVDQPGTLLRDYHTVSTLAGEPLLSSNLNAKGAQVSTSPKKYAHVTKRFYLSDAVFVAAVGGPVDLIADLGQALKHPRFALALGRRACVPSGRLLVPVSEETPQDVVWQATPHEVLSTVRWQAGPRRLALHRRATVELDVTLDDPSGDDVADDVPVDFAPNRRGMTSRTVRHTSVTVPKGRPADDTAPQHDPFELL